MVAVGVPIGRITRAPVPTGGNGPRRPTLIVEMRRVVLRRQEWQDRKPWKWWGNYPTCHSLDVSGSCHASWWFFSDLDSLVEDFARKFHLAISYCDGTPLSWGSQYAWDLYGWRSIQFPISCDNHAVEATQLIIHQQDPIEWTLANFAGGRSGSPWGQPSFFIEMATSLPTGHFIHVLKPLV